jgi:hypothetical protein
MGLAKGTAGRRVSFLDLFFSFCSPFEIYDGYMMEGTGCARMPDLYNFFFCASARRSLVPNSPIGRSSYCPFSRLKEQARQSNNAAKSKVWKAGRYESALKV